ncbi:MAG: sister chromatid cohesion protein PDS5 [Candidatus Freyarchaeum deiterrae]
MNQQEIHRKSISNKSGERREAVELLRNNFAVLPDKTQAWEDLHQLTQDENRGVRKPAAESLRNAFPYISDMDMKQALEDLHLLTQDEDIEVRRIIAESLGAAFPRLSDNNVEQAWEVLHLLTQDGDGEVRSSAVESLGAAFPRLSDNNVEQAWEDLQRLSHDEDWSVRMFAAESLGAAFPRLSDNNVEQAWDVLYLLTQDGDSYVRRGAAESLGTVFPHLPDRNREQAWEVLQQLSQDEDNIVRSSAVESLGTAFPYIPNNNMEEAWEVLQQLSQDEDNIVRSSAVESLGTAFPHLPDRNREQAWEFLQQLSHDRYGDVRIAASVAMGAAYNIHHESLGAKPLTSKRSQCVSCGTQAPSGALYCPHCGELVDPSSLSGESISLRDAVVEEAEETGKEPPIKPTPLGVQMGALHVLYEATIRGSVTGESRLIRSKMLVASNSNMNITSPFISSPNPYARYVFSKVCFAMKLEEGFEGIPNEVLVFTSKFGYFWIGDKVILQGKILKGNFRQLSRPLYIIFADHFYNDSLQIGDEELKGKKQVLYEGTIRGSITRKSRVNASGDVYTPFIENYFVMKLEENIGIVGIPDEILVHSVPTRYIRKGDKVILQGKIVKKYLRLWNKPMYAIFADYFYNESLQVGDEEVFR